MCRVIAQLTVLVQLCLAALAQQPGTVAQAPSFAPASTQAPAVASTPVAPIAAVAGPGSSQSTSVTPPASQPPPQAPALAEAPAKVHAPSASNAQAQATSSLTPGTVGAANPASTSTTEDNTASSASTLTSASVSSSIAPDGDKQGATAGAAGAAGAAAAAADVTLPEAGTSDAGQDGTGDSGIAQLLTPPDGSTVMLSPPTNPSPPVITDDMFVKRRGSQLYLKGEPWYFTGFNAYWFVDAASWGGDHGRKQIAETMSAARRLGMRAARTWAFNSKLPAGPNMYSEKQFLALDYIVYCARVYGLRLILALGNFWAAYKSPEEFLWYALGPTGSGILDFYRQPAVRQLYKSHITTITTRVNKYTGIAYRDDPTILGYDVLNEPRCPGCESPELQNIVVGWMDEMTRYTKQMAPKQLVALGTEGFFTRNDSSGLNLVNPGPGAQCEGEDWPRIVNLPAVDFATLHVYERHMEQQPMPPIGRSYMRDPDWFTCTFGCYVNWLVRYIQTHLEAASSLAGNKPVIVEEFGLTWWGQEAQDRKVVMAVLYRMLASSAASGGALAGALVWNGAHNDSADQDGYNVRLDRWPSPNPPAPPQLHQLGPIMPYLAKWSAMSEDEKDGVPPDVTVQAAGRRLAAASSPATTTPAKSPDTGATSRPASYAAASNCDIMGMGPNSRNRSTIGFGALSQRGLRWQSDKLDGFRRGWDRGSCAHESSRVWRPPLAFVNGTNLGSESSASFSPETLSWMAVQDLQGWRDHSWPLKEVDIIKWASSQINKPNQE